MGNFDPRRMSERWKDDWRVKKREHINNRKKRLKELFKEDLEVDDHALKRDWIAKRGVVKSTRPSPYTGTPLFNSSSMDGSTGYILSDISKYLKANLEESNLEFIKGLVKNQAWIESELGDFGDVRYPTILVFFD